MNRQRVASLCVVLSGILLLLESVFGCYAVLGVGFSTVRDIITDLCLTLAFPIYLLGLLSRRAATVCLWLFFMVQWINMCLLGRPPQLVSPIDGAHDVVLLLGIVLFTIADVASHGHSTERTA